MTPRKRYLTALSRTLERRVKAAIRVRDLQILRAVSCPVAACGNGYKTLAAAYFGGLILSTSA
jgi:hypothetical protein